MITQYKLVKGNILSTIRCNDEPGIICLRGPSMREQIIISKCKQIFNIDTLRIEHYLTLFILPNNVNYCFVPFEVTIKKYFSFMI